MEKYEDLIEEMGLGILPRRLLRPSHLLASSPARINSCALTISHTLKDIIVALSQLNAALQK